MYEYVTQISTSPRHTSPCRSLCQHVDDTSVLCEPEREDLDEVVESEEDGSEGGGEGEGGGGALENGSSSV